MRAVESLIHSTILCISHLTFWVKRKHDILNFIKIICEKKHINLTGLCWGRAWKWDFINTKLSICSHHLTPPGRPQRWTKLPREGDARRASALPAHWLPKSYLRFSKMVSCHMSGSRKDCSQRTATRIWTLECQRSARLCHQKTIPEIELTISIIDLKVYIFPSFFLITYTPFKQLKLPIQLFLCKIKLKAKK